MTKINKNFILKKWEANSPYENKKTHGVCNNTLKQTAIILKGPYVVQCLR